ncbi:MAG TPA: hypothetical protein VD908_14435 [Cytophagales bacterium]|nr:hypothetical protein [Cytophagales bacterium]
MNTRQIKYIDEEEDTLELEVEWAINRSMEDCLIEYCKHIISNYAIAGIDVINFPIKRNIYYLDNEE